MQSIKILLTLCLIGGFVYPQMPENWVVDSHEFEHTMTLTGQLIINDVLQGEIASAVAVFHNDQCRGVAAGTQVGENILYFLLIYANDQGDSLDFRAWDAVVGNVVPLDQCINFSSGAALGEVDAPYQLSGSNSVRYIEAIDDTFMQAEDAADVVPFNILGNDIYDRSLAIAVSFPAEPVHGILMENLDQTFAYASELNFFGLDSFQYRLAHEFGADSAWVRIDVTPVDDPLADFHLLSPATGTLFDADVAGIQTFSWEEPVDYDGDPVTYTLYVLDGDEVYTSYFADETSLEIDIEALPREIWLRWCVHAFDAWGWTVSLDTFTVRVSSLVDTQPVPNLPDRWSLEQNYPNPFNPETRIEYQLPHSADVALRIYDLQGRILVSEFWSEREAGVYFYDISLSYNGITNCKSGIYYYQLRLTDPEDGQLEFQAVRSMLYLK